MPKINVYLSDELAAAVRDAGLSVSPICQRALAEAVRDASAAREAISALREADGDVALDGPATPRLVAAIARARALAGPRRRVGSEHLLAGVLDEPGNLGVQVLRSLGGDPDALRRSASRKPRPSAPPADDDAPLTERLSSEARDALARALEAALALGHDFLGCEHLVLGLAEQPDGRAAAALRDANISPDAIRRAIPAAVGAAALGYKSASPDRLDALERRLAAIERRLR